MNTIDYKIKSSNKNFLFIILKAYLLLQLITANLLFANEQKTQLPLEELHTFSEVFNHIKSSYHKDITDSELINAAIAGMLNNLGEHSRYYSKQEFSHFNLASDGGYQNSFITSVTMQVLPSKIGYISISQFTKKTPEEVVAHLNVLTHKHQVTSIIIDLRNNLGGVLESSVQVADLFLNNGLIYSSKGKAKDSNRRIKAKDHTPYKDIPIFVIINKNSASSSEILAGALQDNNRATILGETSYGKGTIQTVFSLRSGAGVKITTSEYFTPKGHKIQGNGIIPDVKFNIKNLHNNLNSPALDDLQLYQAYLLLSSNIKLTE